jgi:hypothetical protein
VRLIETKISMTETETTKLDCIQSLVIGINRTAFWRETTAEKYPLDPRNARGSARLSEIAASVKDLTDDEWSELQPFCSWESDGWREAISRVSRMVGFQPRVKDLASFVAALIGFLRT